MKTLAQGIAVVAFFAVTVRFVRKSMEFLDNNDNSGARSTLFERGALRYWEIRHFLCTRTRFIEVQMYDGK